MKHLKSTFVGLLALTAASDAFAQGPPGPPPMGGGLPAPPMGGGPPGLPMAGGLPGLPGGGVLPGGPPMGGGGPGGNIVASGPAGNASGNIAARGPAGNVSGSGNNYGGNSVNNYGSGNYGKGDGGGYYGNGYYGNRSYWGGYGPAPLPEPRQERQPRRTTGRQRPITITPRHTTILVGTLITGATTPRLFHAPSDDAP